MENSYHVIISNRAEENLDQIIAYLELEWNEVVKNNFIDKLKEIIALLEVNPLLFEKYSRKKNIHKCLITKHNAMYYRIIDTTVEIITIHDTRRNPNTLKLF